MVLPGGGLARVGRCLELEFRDLEKDLELRNEI